jgi:hypothetical protein
MKLRIGILTLLVGLASVAIPLGAHAAPACFGHAPTIAGTLGDDVLIGTEGPDVIIGRLGRDEIHGRGGDDRICGGWGVDRIFGEDGSDMVTGEGKGGEWISGGSGNDAVHSGDGRDFLEGGPGDDLLNGDLPGGLYGDIATYENAAGPVTVNLAEPGTATGEGTDTLRNIGVVFGSQFGDNLTVGQLATDGHYPLGRARLFGLDGSDILDATHATGPVVLDAGFGNDTLLGSDKADQLRVYGGVDTADGNGGTQPQDEFATTDRYYVGCMFFGADDPCPTQATVFGTDDPDFVWVTNGNLTAHTFGGHDQALVDRGTTTIDMSGGADSLVIDDGAMVTADTGDGPDYILLRAGFNPDQGGTAILETGGGDDFIEPRDPVSSATIRTSIGDDFINVEDGLGDDSVAAGDGVDTCLWDPGDTVQSCTRPPE